MIPNTDVRLSIWVSPLGAIRLAVSPLGLAGAWFEGDRHGPDPLRTAQWRVDDTHPVITEARLQLAAYFNGDQTPFKLPLDLRLGTPFQQLAWQTLGTIGYGQTITYGELAARMGKPSASRAAGAAIGRNPLAIIVPCHRVVGSNGSLTGYAGGLDRKLALLQLEGAWI